MAKTKIQTQISHVAFIMDGNGRWAKARGLKRSAGHREGAKATKRIVEHCFKCGVKCVSVYAFSTENWSRPKEEIEALFLIVKNYVKNILKGIDKNNYKVTFMGDTSKFPPELVDIIEEVKKRSANKTGGIFNLGLNYGSRDEIVRAVNLAVKNGKEQTIDSFDKLMYTGEHPPLDLIIRTSGEQRLSNFMLWQVAYAELFFTDTFWPDFETNELDSIFDNFSNRDRRYGGVKE
ncbi:MAG: polyprenyl diphosphate synthase [Firmicutes bacterium]|nr:polyprenyl diphosphate synthase [Bacillota bacterium]